MIEEQAYVVRLHGDYAEISTLKQSACTSCAAKGGCGTSLLAAWFPQRRLTFRLKNDIGAQAGDRVIVGLDESLLQRSSFLLYAVPLAGLLGGAMLGEHLAGQLAFSPELGAVLAGLSGMSAALLYVRQRTGAARAGHGGGLRLLRVTRRAITIAPDDMSVPRVRQPEGFRKYE